jgi:hypothetical protein
VGDGGRRSFRFGEIRRAGLFGSMPSTLLAALGVVLVVGWLAVAGFVPWLLAGPLAVAGLAVALGRVQGRPLHAVLPTLVRFGWRRLRGRHRWFRPVPLVSDDGIPTAQPAPLAGLDLYELDITWTHAGGRHALGAVHDRAAGTVSATIRVHGDGQFALLDDREQIARADAWGGALAGFARERCQVLRVKWDDWAAPVPLQEQIGDLGRRWADEPASDTRDAYLQLLRDVAPEVVRHEVTITVTVAVPRIRRGPFGRSGSLDAALTTLGEELRLLRDRLDTARVQAQVMSATDLIVAARLRSDPAAREQLAGLRQSLAAATGAAAPNFGPMTIAEEVALVRVDRAVHRSWWFARWPRREVVDAGWLSVLLNGMDCVRTVSAVFEPIHPRASDRDVDRELVKREANMESRRRRDFRVTGKDRKAFEEAEAREGELNAGFAEMFYVGLVTLTAPDEATLEAQAGQLEQAAAQAGVELMAMWGQQAAGLVASLPLGRSLARRSVTA